MKGEEEEEEESLFILKKTFVIGESTLYPLPLCYLSSLNPPLLCILNLPSNSHPISRRRPDPLPIPDGVPYHPPLLPLHQVRLLLE